MNQVIEKTPAPSSENRKMEEDNMTRASVRRLGLHCERHVSGKRRRAARLRGENPSLTFAAFDDLVTRFRR